ncbi:S-adenosyl-L-methionine-dependent methyltransferase [Apiospora kogelbergensis]|uniref:S-adenosyl-L-methionine-dependent methyltransferase n=1 Tax=Apiospora kogelbergensis TaxID=1337665 RepID=UPI0031323D8B
MRPMPVDGSITNEVSSSRQPFAGFGNYAGTSAEPLLPAQGYQGQAPVFREPGYNPTQDQVGAATMGDYRIPEAHVMSSDAGGGDGYVFNHKAAQPPAVPRQHQLFDPATPRHLQPPSYILESRPGDFRRYGTSPITVWRPHEFLPEDFPEPDPAYVAPGPDHPLRVSSPRLPAEAYIPADVFRETNGTSIVEPESVQAENGRLYNGYREGKYLLPNDPAEQDRLDLQHQGLKTLLSDRLYLAPIQNPKHVLDLATGTGIWPIEFAELFPDAQIVGTDLSQIQPEHRPANVTFVREDSEEEWCYDVKFDYIHARAVFSCFDNPKGVMEKAFANMNPGGYIEYLDFIGVSGCLDGSIQGTSLEKIGVYCTKGASASGRDLLVASHYKQWLKEVGFVDVVERKFAWPYGSWAKSPRLKLAGLFCQRDFYDGFAGMAHVMLKRAGLSREEIERYIPEVRENLIDPAIHAYVPAGFAPDEILPEDFPEIDPLYLSPGVVSPTEIPASQSGIPPEAWIPADIYPRAHPESRVIGTDLSKIQPENTPANVEFIRDDAEEPWEFGPTTKFDYVHLRAVFSCFDDPKFVMRQAFENMNPGGWIEYMDGTVSVASMDGTVEEHANRLPRVVASYATVVDVHERKFAAPMGTWCKDERLKHIGRMFQRNLYDNIRGIVYRVMDTLGYTGEQIDEFADKFRADLVNPHIHGYMPM